VYCSTLSSKHLLAFVDTCDKISMHTAGAAANGVVTVLHSKRCNSCQLCVMQQQHLCASAISTSHLTNIPEQCQLVCYTSLCGTSRAVAAAAAGRATLQQTHKSSCLSLVLQGITEMTQFRWAVTAGLWRRVLSAAGKATFQQSNKPSCTPLIMQGTTEVAQFK
jgi:hypothetical protein